MKNIIYLLVVNVQSLKKLQLEIVLAQFKELINNSKITLDVYMLINEFIGNQKSINKNELIVIIELMINKIIYDKGSIWDNKAVKGNYLYNPVMKWKKEWKYSNKILIEDFLNKLKSYEIQQQIQISQGFLIDLYYISNDEIQDLIKTYVLGIINLNKIVGDDESEVSNYGLKITFKLFLAIEKFIEINDDLIEEIKQYPLQEKNNIYFLEQITGQVHHIWWKNWKERI